MLGVSHFGASQWQVPYHLDFENRFFRFVKCQTATKVESSTRSVNRCSSLYLQVVHLLHQSVIIEDSWKMAFEEQISVPGTEVVDWDEDDLSEAQTKLLLQNAERRLREGADLNHHPIEAVALHQYVISMLLWLSPERLMLSRIGPSSIRVP